MQAIPVAIQTFLEQEKLTAFQNNVAVCFLSVVTFRLTQELFGWLSVRFRITIHCKTTLFYVVLSLCLMFWPLYDKSNWSWRLNTILPLAMLVRFVYKGAFMKDFDDELESWGCAFPSQLLPLMQFASILVIMGLCRFQTAEAAVVTAAVGIGDAIAPVIGGRFGRHPYQMPLASQKTMEGSVCGVFMGSCSATYFFLFCLRIRPLLPLRLVLSYALIAAFVEGTCPGYTDNLAVSLAIHFSMDNRVEQWLEQISSYFGGGS
jgi:dolichol kinase